MIASTSNLLPEVKYDTFPTASIITYKFPEREQQPPVKLIWYDGGILPLHDDRLRDLKYESCGALLIGEKGIIVRWPGRLSPCIPGKDATNNAYICVK